MDKEGEYRRRTIFFLSIWFISILGRLSSVLLYKVSRIDTSVEVEEWKEQQKKVENKVKKK